MSTIQTYEKSRIVNMYTILQYEVLLAKVCKLFKIHYFVQTKQDKSKFFFTF